MPDAEFSKIGEAFGAYGEKVTNPDDVPAALARCVEGGARRPRRDPARAGDEAVGGEPRAATHSASCAGLTRASRLGDAVRPEAMDGRDQPGHGLEPAGGASGQACARVRRHRHARARFARAATPPPTRPATSRSSSPTVPAARPTSSRALVAQKLQDRLGQTFVVLNRPGASGTIGITAAMRAAPDGYTLYVGYTAETVVVPQISKTHKYSVVDDFEPIAITGLVPVVLTVSKNVKADNLKDFIDEVRANPGKYTYRRRRRQPAARHGRLDEQDQGPRRAARARTAAARKAVNDVVGGHIDMFYGGVAVSKAAIDSGGGQGAGGDRRHALVGAAERADLQGGRRAGVRAGELDRACWRPRARRPTSSALLRKETLVALNDPEAPRERWHGRASSRARPRTCVPSWPRVREVRPRGARAWHHDGAE